MIHLTWYQQLQITCAVSMIAGVIFARAVVVITGMAIKGMS